MFDENGNPSDALAIDWAERNDHAEDLANDERDDTDLPAGRVWRPATAVGCATCGASVGEECHAVQQRGEEVVHWEWVMTAPHPERLHTAGRRCADLCDECPAEPDDWSTPDGSRITVRLDGADEALVVLWESGATSVETIRTVCEALDRDIDGGNVYEGIAVVYLRYRGRLVQVSLYCRSHGDRVVIEVVHLVADRFVSVALGSIPAPADSSTIRPTAAGPS